MSAVKIALGLNKGEFSERLSAIVKNHAVNAKIIGKPKDLILTACRMTDRWGKMANDPTVEVRIRNWKMGPRKVKTLVLFRPSDKREQPVTKGQLVDQLYPPRKTVNHASPEKKHAHAVRAAMRTAVDYQLKDYRKTLKYPVECYHTQRQIRRGMRLDVDHIVKPFVQICDEFVQSFDLTYCDISLVGPPNLKRFKDSEMYDAWKLFHEMHARLAPSCPKANRAVGSGEYQASEALIGSFAKTDDDDIDMDF